MFVVGIAAAFVAECAEVEHSALLIHAFDLESVEGAAGDGIFQVAVGIVQIKVRPAVALGPVNELPN